jgi:hypothetical protein
MASISTDKKFFWAAATLIVLPLLLAFFGQESFRYPCQNPDNWEKDICKLPKCDVTRTCPEHIFKGQKDPRLTTSTTSDAPQSCAPVTRNQGANCGK